MFRVYLCGYMGMHYSDIDDDYDAKFETIETAYEYCNSVWENGLLAPDEAAYIYDEKNDILKEDWEWKDLLGLE